MATVLVPTPLRRLTNGQSKVVASGNDIAAVLQAIDTQYPGFNEKLINDDGDLKRFINVFVNSDEIRTLQGLQTPIAENDSISIIPAMAGGEERQHGQS